MSLYSRVLEAYDPRQIKRSSDAIKNEIKAHTAKQARKAEREGKAHPVDVFAQRKRPYAVFSKTKRSAADEVDDIREIAKRTPEWVPHIKDNQAVKNVVWMHKHPGIWKPKSGKVKLAGKLSKADDGYDEAPAGKRILKKKLESKDFQAANSLVEQLIEIKSAVLNS